MTTDANVTFTNDWDTATEVKTDNTNMDKTLPSPLNVDSRSTKPIPPAYISAYWWPKQSSFNLRFRNNTISVNIGQGLYNTGINDISGPPFEAGAMLAPINPFTTDTDYRFFFFAGPAILPPLINSYISANLPALSAYIRKNPIDFGKFGEFSLILRQFEAESFVCTYATMNPAGPSQWRMNVILNFTGEAGGDFSWGSWSTGLTLRTKGMSFLLQTSLDLRDLSNPSFVLNTFQISIMDYSLSTSVPLPKVLPAYQMAGFVNTKWNKDILDGLNELLRRLLKGKSLSPGFEVSTSLNPGPVIHRRTWMSSPAMQAKTLNQVTFPGTHDAHAFDLSTMLGQIKYPDDAFLWDLDPGSAPTDGQSPPWQLTKKYLGRNLYDYVIRRVMFVSLAQGGNFQTQLDEGIRWFDIRPYWDDRDGGELYTQHGLRGPKLSDLFSQVKAFLDSVSSSHEIIMLVLSHANFGNYPTIAPSKVAETAERILGNYAYWPAGAESGQPYNFNGLLGMKLSEIATDGPKVLILNADGAALPKPIINSAGFTDQSKQIWCSMTPAATDIVFNAVAALTGNEQLLLKQIGIPPNSRLGEQLAKGGTVNLVGMDWYNYYGGQGEPPIELIMRKNGVDTPPGFAKSNAFVTEPTNELTVHELPEWKALYEDEFLASVDLASVVKTTPEDRFVIYNIKTNKYINIKDEKVVCSESSDFQWYANQIGDEHTWTFATESGNYIGLSPAPWKDGASLIVSKEPFVWDALLDGGNIKVRTPGTNLFATGAADDTVILSPESAVEEQLWYFSHV
ncbi:pi-plc x domain-containing protein 3 [Moniliophthora roreri MCA 2997]|uniref:Pi-plc x domain-containing protein 3 n=1 Tax=Moniliophthora roreri (strain MCA 2997) TaxID=1381753 RepID=V2WR59_MONRO|nr:pi-plc x domain-containing protein 3 [Moniliophthora roreri MCA 2997]